MSKSIYDRVAEAAESLVARGLKPTMAAVRDELGGGSLRDISPALRKWRDKAEQSSSETTPIPPELMAVLQRSSQALWSAAESRANELLSAFRAKSDVKVASLEAERDEALLENGRIETQLNESKSTITKLQAEIAAANARVDRAEGRVEAIERERSRLESVIEAANQNRQQARDHEQQARDEAAELRGQCKILSDQVARLEKRLSVPEKIETPQR